MEIAVNGAALCLFGLAMGIMVMNGACVFRAERNRRRGTGGHVSAVFFIVPVLAALAAIASHAAHVPWVPLWLLVTVALCDVLLFLVDMALSRGGGRQG